MYGTCRTPWLKDVQGRAGGVHDVSGRVHDGKVPVLERELALFSAFGKAG